MFDCTDRYMTRKIKCTCGSQIKMYQYTSFELLKWEDIVWLGSCSKCMMCWYKKGNSNPEKLVRLKEWRSLRDSLLEWE